eukprot:3791233-Pyramimonas_sp.AAC.1
MNKEEQGRRRRMRGLRRGQDGAERRRWGDTPTIAQIAGPQQDAAAPPAMAAPSKATVAVDPQAEKQAAGNADGGKQVGWKGP